MRQIALHAEVVKKSGKKSGKLFVSRVASTDIATLEGDRATCVIPLYDAGMTDRSRALLGPRSTALSVLVLTRREYI